VHGRGFLIHDWGARDSFMIDSENAITTGGTGDHRDSNGLDVRFPSGAEARIFCGSKRDG
jgi:hypothetical protein